MIWPARQDRETVSSRNGLQPSSLIGSMPRSEKLRRERLVWEGVQLRRAGGNIGSEADLERLNPAFYKQSYLPQKERMLQAERAAELAEERKG